MPYPYAYIPPPYVPNQMWGHATISTWLPQYPAWGAPGTPSICIRQVSTTSTRLIGRHLIRWSPHTCRTRLPDYSASKADQSGRGHMPVATERTTKKDIIKIGTTDVVIQKESEGPMIFGETANTNKTEDTTTIKITNPKYSVGNG
jgi:hypothetical protein